MRGSKVWVKVIATTGFIVWAFTQLHSQRVQVETNRTAGLGWIPWYEMHTDPDNPSNVIICGSKWNSKNNASYGFVYFSADGGRSWRSAMEDRSTAWVSEQSCAYGVHGVAYFVADASKIVGDELNHGLGTTRIYASQNAGKTWKLAIKTGWTDYSASVVDVAPGGNQNRLYVFFNDLSTFYNSLGEQDAVKREEEQTEKSTRVGMISYKDGDTQVAGPFTSSAMADQMYHGSYPAPAILLKDGSLLTIYTVKRRNKDDGREFLAEAVRASKGRTSLEVPVEIAKSVERREEKQRIDCSGVFLTSSATYDWEHDVLYYVYSDIQDQACQLFVTKSTDGGRTWSAAENIYSDDEAPGHVFANLAIAVNKEGTVGAMWQEKYRSGCWRFATSNEGDRVFSHSHGFGTCSNGQMKPGALSSAYLWSSFSQANSKNPGSTAHIGLRNTHNSVWRNQNAITASPDGKFHIVWTDPGNGDGELRTATISVTNTTKLIEEGTQGLTDETENVAVLYGGNQSYDPGTKILTLGVTVRNDSGLPLKAPIKIAVPAGGSSQFAEIANAGNGVSGQGAVWDLSSTVTGGTLPPGASTKPFELKFRYLANPETPRGSDDILGLSVRVYAAR